MKQQLSWLWSTVCIGIGMCRGVRAGVVLNRVLEVECQGREVENDVEDAGGGRMNGGWFDMGRCTLPIIEVLALIKLPLGWGKRRHSLLIGMLPDLKCEPYVYHF